MSEDSFVVVKYDYVAQESHELTIHKEERLRVLDDSFNWWKVLNESGESGLVPSNFLRRERGSFIDRAKGTLGIGKSRSRSSIPSAHFDQVESLAATSGANIRNPLNEFSSVHIGKMPDVISYAIAKFNYEPAREDELKLCKEDHLTVLDKSSDGWWRGELNGISGWFPSNYVEETNTPPSSAAPTAPQPVNQHSNGYNSQGYSGNGISNYPLQNSSFINGSTGREQVLEVVVALYNFDAQNAEELSFRKGERLDVLDHPAYDPDWYKARNTHGEVGLIPTNYIEIVERNPSGYRATTSATPKSYGGNLTGPYANQPWYFGPLSREQSDYELNARGIEGCFLVRDSESNPGDYSISLKGNIRNKHFWIQVDTSSGTYKIGNRTFPSMEQLIQHYTKAPIFSSEESGERLYLVKPLARS